MRTIASYPVIVTERLKECRDFYVQFLGCNVVFEASWFVYLSSEQGGSWGIAFMSPDHPSHPPSPKAFDGNGMFLTLQVENADEMYDQLKALEAPITYPLKVEAWGQRRFAVTDPSGVWIDIVEQIAPLAGFWDPYLT
jgi:catechol 2,3-dioxygenase-like lactoylglutathione lyase family enzyme